MLTALNAFSGRGGRMAPIYYFDICALLVLCMTLFFMIRRRLYLGGANKLFLGLVFLTIFVTGCSLVTAIASNYKDLFSTEYRFFMHSCYLFFHSMYAPVYLAYVILLMDLWHRLRGNVPLLIFLCAPIAVIFGFILANPWTRNIFYIDEQKNYARSDMFFVLYLGVIFYMCITFGLLIKNRSLMSRDRRRSLLSVYPLMIVACVMQYLWPQLLVEMFATSIAIMIITNTVQRPEDILSQVKGFRNLSSYARNMKRCFINKKDVSIIMIHISDIANLKTVLNYDRTDLLIQRVGELLLDMGQEYRCDYYYIDNGRYRLVFDSYAVVNIHAFAEKIYNRCKEEVELNDVKINFKPIVCVVDHPEDVIDFDTLIMLGNKLNDIIKQPKEILNAADIIHKNEFGIVNNVNQIIDEALEKNILRYFISRYIPYRTNALGQQRHL